MTSTVITTQNFAATTASYRLWGKAFHDAIIALGWVQTADTGQVDWATVTLLGSGVITHYEIFKANDALAGTNPIYVKFNYGMYTAPSPMVYAQVGMASDGVGNLKDPTGFTGSVSTSRAITAASSSEAIVAAPMYFGGDAGTLAISMCPAPSGTSNTLSNGGGLLVERCRNYDGTASARGFYTAWWFSGNAVGSSVFSRTTIYDSSLAQFAEQIGATTVVNSVMPGSALDGSTIYPLPIFTGNSPRLNAPSQFVTLIGPVDMAAGTVYTMSHYGVTQTWIATGINPNSGLALGSANQGSGPFGGVGANAKMNSVQIRIS